MSGREDSACSQEEAEEGEGPSASPGTHAACAVRGSTRPPRLHPLQATPRPPLPGQPCWQRARACDGLVAARPGKVQAQRRAGERTWPILTNAGPSSTSTRRSRAAAASGAGSTLLWANHLAKVRAAEGWWWWAGGGSSATWRSVPAASLQQPPSSSRAPAACTAGRLQRQARPPPRAPPARGAAARPSWAASRQRPPPGRHTLPGPRPQAPAALAHRSSRSAPPPGRAGCPRSRRSGRRRTGWPYTRWLGRPGWRRPWCGAPPGRCRAPPGGRARCSICRLRAAAPGRAWGPPRRAGAHRRAQRRAAGAAGRPGGRRRLLPAGVTPACCGWAGRRLWRLAGTLADRDCEGLVLASEEAFSANSLGRLAPHHSNGTCSAQETTFSDHLWAGISVASALAPGSWQHVRHSMRAVQGAEPGNRRSGRCQKDVWHPAHRVMCTASRARRCTAGRRSHASRRAGARQRTTSLPLLRDSTLTDSGCNARRCPRVFWRRPTQGPGPR
jgi:hypothetical protein